MAIFHVKGTPVDVEVQDFVEGLGGVGWGRLSPLPVDKNEEEIRETTADTEQWLGEGVVGRLSTKPRCGSAKF